MKLLSIRIPSIAQNSAIYIVFNVLQRAINFFLLPLYTIYLTPEDYGTINVLTSTAALLTFLLTFSVQSASSRFHYKYKRSDSIIKTIWGSNLIFIIINSLFWSILVMVGYNYSLKYLIGNEIQFYPYVLICILNCCFSPIYLYFQNYLQTTQNARYFVINNFLQFVCLLGLTICFVVFFHWKALGVLLANLIVNGIFAIYAVCALRKYITYKFSLAVLKKSLQYSIPLLPHTLSGWLNSMLDRIFVNRLINLANVGLYSIGYQFGLVVNMVSFGINQAYTPWFFQNHDSIDGKRRIRIVSDVSILFICVIGVLLSLFAQEILFIMTDAKYHNVWPIIVILVAANLFDGVYKFYVAVLFLDNTKLLSTISISCSLMTCALNYILISNVGYEGAALTYLIVQFAVSLIVCGFARKLRPDIDFNYIIHYLEIIILMVIVCLVDFPMMHKDIIYRMVVKFFVFLLSIVILALFNFKSIHKYLVKK